MACTKEGVTMALTTGAQPRGGAMMITRYLVSLPLRVLLAMAVCGSAQAQTPTPTPTGEFLCSAGPHDGRACNHDGDCAPGGACVIAPGICAGGNDDGLLCDCVAGSCSAAPVCSTAPTFGTCQSGVNATQCCNVTHNCASGSPCVGTQKICVGGPDIGLSCLRDDQCPGSLCQSTGKFCSGGDFDSFTCVDDVDCHNADGSQGGVCTAVAVQPTPIPTGEFLCSGGQSDGHACNGDNHCAPGGVCVVAVGICGGGSDDGLACDCVSGNCSSTPACSGDATFGTCQGGVNAALCCDVTHNCSGGSPCVGTQKLCVGGGNIGGSCLRDDQCPGSSCLSTGRVCVGGDFDGFPCVDENDCTNVDRSAGGACIPAGTTPACVGDCDGGGAVTVNELITMVNIALGSAPLSGCPSGDADGTGNITVNEIIQSVNFALGGCAG